MNSTLNDAISAVMELLCAGASSIVTRDQVAGLQQRCRPGDIENAVEKLRQAGLVEERFLEGTLRATMLGTRAFVSDTYLPLVYGKNYLVTASGRAVAHIIVSGTNTDEAGATGFYCADVGNRMVTAAHNVLGRKILRIEDEQSTIQHRGPIKVLPTIPGLDLAIVDVVAPPGCLPLKVERETEEIVLQSLLVVFGFPRIPQRLISLVCRDSRLLSKGTDFSHRDSYLITRVTEGGFSGGPAVNERGRVVGIVQGSPHSQNSANTEGSFSTPNEMYDADYSALTPATLVDVLLAGGVSQTPLLKPAT